MHDVVSTLYQRSVRCLPETNLMNRAPTRTTQLKFLLHPQQRGLLSFISQLVIRQKNSSDGLVGFKGGSKSLSVPKTAAQETYTGRRISPSYQPQSILGLLKACYTSYFHNCLKFRTHHGYKLWNCLVDQLDLDDPDGPPNSPRCGCQALTPAAPIISFSWR